MSDDVYGTDFGHEVRAFLRAIMADADAHADPSDLTGLSEDFERRAHRDAGARGYLDAGTAARRACFTYEAAYHDAPLVDTACTLGGAPLRMFGSPQQHDELLEPMRRGEVTLCIAYTEPQAGSDLSAIATTARREGRAWVIDGEKVLVTGAHKADWCLLVARTDQDAPAHDAMSMFAVPMSAPGISVHRIRTANDWTLGRVTFEGVRVPESCLVGTEGRGFAQMTAALSEERSGAAWLGWTDRLLDELLAHARAHGVDAVTRDRLAELWIETWVARRHSEQVVAAQERGEDTTVGGALAKVFLTELLQRIADTGVALLGPSGLLTGQLFGTVDRDAPLRGRFAYECVERRHPTISVGANELQRDVIARRALGLPNV